METKETLFALDTMNKTRDAARKQFGKEYSKAIKPFVVLMKKVMKANTIGPVAALKKISETDLYDTEVNQMLFVSAAIDLMDEKIKEVNKKPLLKRLGF